MWANAQKHDKVCRNLCAVRLETPHKIMHIFGTFKVITLQSTNKYLVYHLQRKFAIKGKGTPTYLTAAHQQIPVARTYTKHYFKHTHKYFYSFIYIYILNLTVDTLHTEFEVL